MFVKQWEDRDHPVYGKSESIFIAVCLMKRSEQFNTKVIQSLFKKPQQSVSYNKISLFYSY